MKYPLFKVAIDVDDSIRRIRNVFKSGFVNEGQEVTEFGLKLSEKLDVTNLVLMNSCTSALTVAYKLAGVGPGAEVITSPMTCIATNTPIVNLGGTIVWCDIDPSTGNIDAEKIESLITDRTKAIAYVNWAGNPSDLERIQAIGTKHRIKVIQDAAHSYGATWDTKPISEFADFTCFSFQAIKHLSCGDGGALVCKSDQDYALAKKMKWFGYDREATKDEKGDWKGQRWDADIEDGEIGFKFNMNNVAAAIGLAGLENIDWLLEQHRKNALIYSQEFSNYKQLQPLTIPKRASSSFWTYSCVLNEEEMGQNGVIEMSRFRDEILRELNRQGIGAGLMHLPNDTYSAFRSSSRNLPGVRKFESAHFSLPCGWWLNDEDIFMIAQQTKNVVDSKLRLL